MHHSFGALPGVAECLMVLASTWTHTGRSARAARLFAAAGCLRDGMGTVVPLADRDGYECTVAAARDALGDESFEAAYAEGQAMTMDEAVAYALSDEDNVPEPQDADTE